MAMPYYRPKPGHKYHRKVEESLQLRICNYIRHNFPGVVFRSDFSSGLYLTPGLAAKHARLQSGKGFPDLCIYAQSADGQHPAMFLELKREGTRVFLKNGQLTSDAHIREQAEMLAYLKSVGFYAEFGIGHEDCINQINEYFGIPIQEELF